MSAHSALTVSSSSMSDAERSLPWQCSEAAVPPVGTRRSCWPPSWWVPAAGAATGCHCRLWSGVRTCNRSGRGGRTPTSSAPTSSCAAPLPHRYVHHMIMHDMQSGCGELRAGHTGRDATSSLLTYFSRASRLLASAARLSEYSRCCSASRCATYACTGGELPSWASFSLTASSNECSFSRRFRSLHPGGPPQAPGGLYEDA